jgi:hypothetical protein
MKATTKTANSKSSGIPKFMQKWIVEGAFLVSVRRITRRTIELEVL